MLEIFTITKQKINMLKTKLKGPKKILCPNIPVVGSISCTGQVVHDH